jgi:hypothetical protein
LLSVIIGETATVALLPGVFHVKHQQRLMLQSEPRRSRRYAEMGGRAAVQQSEIAICRTRAEDAWEDQARRRAGERGAV